MEVVVDDAYYVHRLGTTDSELIFYLMLSLGLDRDPMGAAQKALAAVVELMKQVSLNQSRVEALVQQLFDLNKHLQSLEGKLLRLATSARVTRESFLANYMGHELDHDWLERVSRVNRE